jgi:NarL family two-component system response regulator LiaR
VHASSECNDLSCRRIRVLVVDGHAAARHAIATFVAAQDDMELAGEAADGEEALGLCACSRPDVVLLGVTLPGLSAAETTHALRERWPLIQVVAMSTFQEEERVPEVLRAGAVTYLLKDVSGEELTHAVRRACAA